MQGTELNARRTLEGIAAGFAVFAASAIITGATGNVAYVQTGVLRGIAFFALFARDLGSGRRNVSALIFSMDMGFGAIVAEGFRNQGWVFGFLLIGIVETLVYLWVTE